MRVGALLSIWGIFANCEVFDPKSSKAHVDKHSTPLINQLQVQTGLSSQLHIYTNFVCEREKRGELTCVCCHCRGCVCLCSQKTFHRW